MARGCSSPRFNGFAVSMVIIVTFSQRRPQESGNLEGSVKTIDTTSQETGPRLAPASNFKRPNSEYSEFRTGIVSTLHSSLGTLHFQGSALPGTHSALSILH